MVGKNRIKRYAVALLRHRIAVIGIGLVAILLLGLGGVRVGFNNDARVFFDADNPYRLALEAMEKRFSESNDILIVLAFDDGDIFTPQRLAMIERLSEGAWQVPFATRVDSLTNFQLSRAEGDDLTIDNLVRNAADLSAAGIAAVREAVQDEPFLRDFLVSPDHSMTALAVNLVYDKNAPQAAEEAALAARALADSYADPQAGIHAYLTGSVMMSSAFSEATARDIAVLVPVMLLVAGVLLAFLLRSFVGMLIGLGSAVAAAAAAVGFAGWGGFVLNPGSASTPTVVIALAIASNVHILVAYLERRQRGVGAAHAVVSALQNNMGPVFLTNATTAIGFLSLNASDSPPFRDLGNLVAVGITVGFLISVTVVPALVVSIGDAMRPMPDSAAERRLLAGLSRFVIRRHKPLAVFCLLVAGLAISGIREIRLNDNWIEYFDSSYRMRTDTEAISHGMGGVNFLEYVLDTGRDGGIYDPQYLRLAERFTQWVASQPDVSSVNSVIPILKRLNRNLHGDDGKYYRLPGSADLAAQYLLLYEMSLPMGLTLGDRVDVARAATRITVATTARSTTAINALDQRIQDWFRVGGYADAQNGGVLKSLPEGTGLAIMFTHMSERNIRSMLRGTFFALVLVSAILMLALGSLSIGFLSLLPNLLPAAIAFGLWGYFIGEIGIAISIVAAITFGIVVDDTIHFLTRYLRAKKRGFSNAEGVAMAFDSVGKALFTTTAVLVGGFLALTVSGFQPTWGMGYLASLTVSVALVADFILLPSLLVWLRLPD